MKKLSLLDQKILAAQSMNFYARISDKPLVDVPEKKERKVKQKSIYDEPLESKEQSFLVSWWFHYSKTIGLDHRILLSIPNAQRLLAFATNRHAFIQSLRNEGFRVGAPDLVLFCARGKYHGMLIEMKRRTKGTISPEQKEMAELLESQGYKCVIGRGADNAIAEIKNYLRG